MSKKQQTATLIYHAIVTYVPTTGMPLNFNIYQLVHVQISDNYISRYSLYELPAINNVSTSTCIHTFHIDGIAPA